MNGRRWFAARTTVARRALVALCCLASALALAAPARALDDGLARTPPMGFNNWNATHCASDFNEEMVKATADIFVESGLKDAGYEYVNLDDCWARPQNSPGGSRDAGGHLVADPVRFPSGIKALADYVHSKGPQAGHLPRPGNEDVQRARIRRHPGCRLDARSPNLRADRRAGLRGLGRRLSQVRQLQQPGPQRGRALHEDA
jgi:hypothetical protein